MANYTIKKGDTLSRIASNFGTTVEELAKTNGISNPNLIQAGATLVVPVLDKLGIGNTETKEEDTGWNGYTPFEHPDYQESDAVKDAENKKNAADDALANYGDFSYKNQAGLDEIMQKILNREDFSYDFNSDALYQQYKDKYIKQGKMAMQDTIGQASAMTGGYGNSYAATVGNQAYQASLENLNDVIPELYQMAYDRYNQQGQDMLNQYGLLSDDYNREYGVWEAGYNRLADDRSYYGTQFDNERSWDYGKWADDRDFKQIEHQTEQDYLYKDHRDKITDEQWEKSYDLQDRAQDLAEKQYNDSLAKDSGNSNNPNSSNNPNNTEPTEEIKGYSGNDYNEAVDYAKSYGVPSDQTGGILSGTDWTRKRTAYILTGQGGTEVTAYKTYKSYLEGITEYLINTYGK